MVDKAEIAIDLTGVSPDLRADLTKQLKAFNVGLAETLARVSSAEPMSPAQLREGGALKHAQHVLAHGVRESLGEFAGTHGIGFVDSAEAVPELKT